MISNPTFDFEEYVFSFLAGENFAEASRLLEEEYEYCQEKYSEFSIRLLYPQDCPHSNLGEFTATIIDDTDLPF